jgi:hypothetical protein
MHPLSTEHPSLITALDIASVRLRLLRYRPLGTAVAIASAIAVGGLSWWLGASECLSLVYLVPVVLSGLWLGALSAVVVAGVASAAFFLSAHALQPAAPLLPVAWAGITKLVIFVAMGLMVARMHRSQKRLAEATHRLVGLVDRERLLARTDPHTGLPNFRALLEYLSRETDRCRRLKRPLFQSHNLARGGERYRVYSLTREIGTITGKTPPARSLLRERPRIWARSEPTGYRCRNLSSLSRHTRNAREGTAS